MYFEYMEIIGILQITGFHKISELLDKKYSLQIRNGIHLHIIQN
jgi:hypothetical protein